MPQVARGTVATWAIVWRGLTGKVYEVMSFVDCVMISFIGVALEYLVPEYSNLALLSTTRKSYQ